MKFINSAPDITQFKTGAQFYGGTIDQIMLR